MPFARDTLAVIQSKTLADIQSQLPGSDPLLQKSILNILGATFSEIQNSLYGYLDRIARDSVPYTAEDEAFYAWAALKRQFPKPSTSATGTWTFPCVAPATIVAGQVVNRSDGVAYVTTEDVTEGVGANITVPLQAIVPGAAGTIVTGISGVLASPVANVTSQGAGTAGTPGVDLEAFDAFKTRVLAVFGQPPQGGSASDYVEWAQEVPGVTRAWCQPRGEGAGTVAVYFMMDDAESAFGGFPQGTNGVATGDTRDTTATGDQLTVANWIYGPTRQPVTALVYARAPIANQVDFTIRLPGASAGLKAAIQAAVVQVFKDKGSPGGVLLTASQSALGQVAGVVNMSDMEAQIAAIAGTAGFLITADSCTHGAIDPASPGNIVSNSGALPILGAITWA